MKTVSTKDLLPGMITATDIYAANGSLIIGKGTPLTDHMIIRLEYHSIPAIKIMAASSEPEVQEEKEEKKEEPSYSEKIRESEEFKAFSKKFDTNVNTLKDSLNTIINKNEKADIDQLLASTDELLESQKSGIAVFDMLHNMRQFDDVTYVHCLNVSLICNVFGKWLDLEEEQLRLLTLCGLMHDIGKLCLPDKIIKKPTKLTEEEFGIIKSHTVQGFRILQKIGMPDCVANAALMHHERCDGFGYPVGMKGNQIDPYAKIVMIADVYDAMTSARVYRGPLCPFEAIKVFEEEGFQRYEAKYILKFLENIGSSYINNRVQLSDNSIGTIIYINPNALSRPLVQVENGYIDLSKEKKLSIKKIL